MTVSDKLTEILKSRPAAPFLFVGSGFSRRYIGLKTWSELLASFCEDIQQFRYYLSKANSELPLAASYMARDFNEVWWKSEKYSAARDAFSAEIVGESSALKVEIAEYLKAASLGHLKDSAFQAEIAALASMNVDGIITTNWDLLLEELFPDYRVFIGQQELLFSNPQAIAEIYKIHGCSTRPNSLVLTQEDYSEFRARNPYLAAKLVTIFAEHPVIFIGYSITDPHIQDIIGDIAMCVGEEKTKEFQENLIFVSRTKGGAPSEIGTAVMTVSGQKIVVTHVKVDDFNEVYSAIEATKRKLPARVLRFCKEQMYELVKSSNPEEKLAVVDFDDIQEMEDVEFVVGIGVAAQHKEQEVKVEKEIEAALADVGYKGISVDDIFLDIIAEKSSFDPNNLLEKAYPNLATKNNRFIPAYRYLNAVGIDSSGKLAESKFDAAKEIVKRVRARGYRTTAYSAEFEKKHKHKSTSEIIAACTPEKACIMMLFQDPGQIDLAAVRSFLRENAGKISKDPYKSYFRKLICYYDQLEFGF